MTLEFHGGGYEAELDNKSPDAFRTISEVAEDLVGGDVVQPHVVPAH